MAEKKKEQETFLTYKPKRISQKVMIGMGSALGSIGALILASKLHNRFPTIGNKALNVGEATGEQIGRTVSLAGLVPKHFMENYNATVQRRAAKSFADMLAENKALPSSAFEKSKKRGRLLTELAAGLGISSLGSVTGAALPRYIDYNDKSGKKK